MLKHLRAGAVAGVGHTTWIDC